MSTTPDGPTPVARKLYGVDDAALQLSISIKEVRRLIGRGELRSVRIGRRRLIPERALVDYVERLTAEAS